MIIQRLKWIEYGMTTDAEGAYVNYHDFEAQQARIERLEADKAIADIVRAYIKKQHISCAETIYQCDWVIQSAYEFIEELAEKAGYYDEDSDSETRDDER